MTESPNLIVVEDDLEISILLADFLRGEGFHVACFESGAALDRSLSRGSRPDLIILDWMLPGEDGLSILRRLRAMNGPPVVMLTAKDEDVDRVLGLEVGADDYVSKPFNPCVLLARIRAVLRRTRPGAAEAGPGLLTVSDLVVDTGRRSAAVDGRELVLTAAEFDLLLCFLTRPQRVLSREQLLDWTRGRTAAVFDRTIDVQLSRLRRKLEEGGSSVADLLKTVRNAGYILAAPVRSG